MLHDDDDERKVRPGAALHLHPHAAAAAAASLGRTAPDAPLRSATPSPTPRSVRRPLRRRGWAALCPRPALLLLLLITSILVTAAPPLHTRAAHAAMRPAAALLAPLLAAVQVAALRLVPAAPAELATPQPLGGIDAALLRHAADWSRDVQPLPVHSHNDYWRGVPVLDALARGVRSVESDVWLHPRTRELFVGHDPYSLSRARTFARLTLAPLRAALEQANAANARYSDSSDARFFAPLQQGAPRAWNGFYTAGPGNAAPLQLLVDLKTDGAATLRAVEEALVPLHADGYLSDYADGRLRPGPLIVIGTGNTRAEDLAARPARNVFLDCPLGRLSETFVVDGVSFAYNSTLVSVLRSARRSRADTAFSAASPRRTWPRSCPAGRASRSRATRRWRT
jgi:hypothetical protein